MKPSEQYIADAILAGLIDARQQYDQAIGPITEQAARKTWKAIQKIAEAFEDTLGPEDRTTFHNHVGEAP